MKKEFEWDGVKMNVEFWDDSSVRISIVDESEERIFLNVEQVKQLNETLQRFLQK